jgi:predicted HTH domain antitoxin
MKTVTLEVPDDALAVAGKSASEFARDVFETAVVKWYDEGRITSGHGAKLLGITRAEFLDLLFRHKVSPFQYTPEELAAELSRG